MEKFHNIVKDGPTFVCSCCDQLWYKKSVQNAQNCLNKIPATALSFARVSIDSKTSSWLCGTCVKYLKLGEVPPYSVENGVHFWPCPQELELFPLEERLVALRVPFMQIRELPRGGQLSLKGNVVNVPADISSVVTSLPRTFSDSQTIPLRFKRKLEYKHSVLDQNIRPNKVLQAAKWLVTNSALYKAEGVTVRTDLDAFSSAQSEQLNVLPFEEDGDTSESNPIEQTSTCIDSNLHEDDWTEVPNFDNRAAGQLDTMLTSHSAEEISNVALCLAPCEGQKPLGLFQDTHSECLSFPSLFCGKPRPQHKRTVHYSDICKVELRHKDRRVSMSVSNIFYKAKKLQIHHIQQQVQLSIRKCKRGNKKLTAGYLKEIENVRALIHQDEGYRVFKSLRGSPPYWERAKKDIFAMIRQCGIPTWFASFSAAETKWYHLLNILAQTIYNKQYTEEELQNLTWEQKCDLIQKDPVTCCRHFDFMVQEFIKCILLSPVHPVGMIEDYFYRVEFQKRGSPHIHMLIWVSDAPQFQTSTHDEITTFIDKYVTCNNTAHTEDMVQLLNYQNHRHAKTCKKYNENICRFSFPMFPFPRTMILQPLDQNMPSEQLLHITANYQKICCELEKMKFGEDITFSQFLDRLQLTEEEYLQAVQSSLKIEKVFLKRSPNEIRVNNYNTFLLRTWRANMDLQFVLHPYACAMYIVSYISKSQRGMSNLLQHAVQECKDGNSSIQESVRHIGNKFLNHIEMSAQEAVYYILQIPLRKATRSFIFINTSPPSDRSFLLKPLSKISQLPDNSHDIESDSLLKKYARRPRKLDNLCLADFAAWYDFSFEQDKEPDIPLDDDSTPENDSNQHSLNNSIYQVGQMLIKKRSKAKIIRYVRYNKHSDSENYFREQLVLFIPWRKENMIICNCTNFQQRYEQVKHQISITAANYNKNNTAVDILFATAEYDLSGHEQEALNSAPNASHSESQDKNTPQPVARNYANLNPLCHNRRDAYDIGQDLGIAVNVTDQEELHQPRLPHHEYSFLINGLNKKQQQFFYHVLNWFKIKKEPIYTFLTGGAGVGKTRLLTALYQALLRTLNSQPGENPDDIKIILVAPTGKAAYNIRGSTIHSAFCIPANKSLSVYSALTSEKLNTLQSKYRHLKLVIIDEISMVGIRLFNYINYRLQQIKGNQNIFGSVSIIAVGDLFQLQPVYDRWIFQNPLDGYSALANNVWKEKFSIFELDEIMRQKDDLLFAQILNRMREGKHTDNDLNTLRKRIETDKAKLPTECLYLFPTNALSENHNEQIYNALQGQKVMVQAVDVVVGDLPNTVIAKIRKSIPERSQETMGLIKSLPVAVGQRVEMCLNTNVSDGLTNGASGIIKYIDMVDDNSVTCIWVAFDDASVGKQSRIENRHYFHRNIQHSWTPVFRASRLFRVGKHHNAQVLRKQFPLRPASAKTVHRSQGDTVSQLVVNIPGKTAHCHICYVALSRVTTMSHLYITNLKDEQVKVSPQVLAEMERLRNERQLTNNLCDLSTIKNSVIVVQQNVRSLKKHIQDVCSDKNIMTADILAFTEANLQNDIHDKQYNIDGYFTYTNCDNSLAIYSKYEAQLQQDFSHISRHVKAVFLSFKTSEVNSSVLIKNFICKPSNLVLTTTTKVYRCAPVTAIPSAFMQEAIKLVHPPDAPVVTIQAAKTSPVKSTTTVRGYIVQDEAVRTVDVRQQPTDVRTIVLEDKTGKAKLSLWRDLAKTQVAPGNYIEAKNVLISTYNNEVTLGSTSRTTLQVLPTPKENVSIEVAAFIKDDLQYEIFTSDEQQFVIEEQLLLSKYKVEAANLEEHLLNLLPFQLEGQTQSKEFINLQ
ncbi:ATP-dependent DNA helicase PIF1 [Holothuria leucospilota]|uniref:ATP-dependent DNA helicase n=1 Tax=Holothuria leucospilota TaxID=206669 RepID=A0A9Q1HG96_HOLLE|nr:ATP-dependent DNA helicase PIF1 [Holothuria leucospilota]